MAKIKIEALREAIRNNLFETTYNVHTTDDKIAGKLGDDRESDLTPPESAPIQPLDQTATQLSRETYPIEDDDWKPQNPVELAGAVEQVASDCPDDQVEYFYKNAVRLANKVRDRANNPKIAKKSKNVDSELEPAIKPKDRKMSESYYKKLDKFIESLNEAGARQKDAARKWKQGDRLDLYRDDDFGDEYDEGYDDEYDDFVPNVDDLRDFMEDNPEADVTKVPGAQDAIDSADPMTLEDLISTGALPNVRGPSGARQYIERTIFDIFRMEEETLDAMMQFTRSDWTKDNFVKSGIRAGLITQEEGSSLRNELALGQSALFREWLNDNFVQPAIRAYRETPKRSGLRGEALVNKIKSRWSALGPGGQGKAFMKSAQNLKNFMSSQAGQSATHWADRGRKGITK